MGIKRLIKKMAGGQIITGHIEDALRKKAATGKSFRECLEESVKETVAEDLPGTSHINQIGSDGRIDGTANQAKRETDNMEELHKEHERDCKRRRKIDKEKDVLLDEYENNIDSSPLD